VNKQEEARHMALAALAAAPPAEQLASPLDYIFAEHFRHRTLCWMIDRIADEKERDEECIAAVLRFLREDFGPHVIDEEEDLFPLLRRRAEPEDRIDEVLGALSQEHAADKLDANAILEDLDEAKAGKRFTKAFRALLHRFAVNERRHLIVENAIVLPLARVRLTVDDLRNLGRRMAARRGIDFLGLSHAV
jgi:iron-sulfur cluster repair protein YtfE (RIC family)